MAGIAPPGGYDLLRQAGQDLKSLTSNGLSVKGKDLQMDIESLEAGWRGETATLKDFNAWVGGGLNSVGGVLLYARDNQQLS